MRALLATLCILLITVPAFADKPAATDKSVRGDYLPHHGPHTLTGEFMTEGFEGAFPPTGWTEVETAPAPYNWYQGSLSVHSGLYSATLDWTASYAQDEQLITGAIDLSEASATDLYLVFWIMGSTYWALNGDTVVHLSSDGASWTEVWRASVDLVASWAWEEHMIDVGAYAGGNLYVKFQYIGTDGADCHLDDVSVGYEEGPPPPPENDTCEDAVANGYFITPGPIALVGNNTAYAHNYTLSYSSCTGYSCSGNDAVWVVDMEDGMQITVTMTTTGWDDSIFLITDCADPHNSCVAGDDAYPDGSTFTYTHTGAPLRHYLIVSAYSSGTGDFWVDGTLTGGIAVEGQTWGMVKSLYR